VFRLHFTAADLARVRIVASLGHYAEALFCLGALAGGRRAGTLFGGWREQVRQTEHGWAGPLYRLIGPDPKLDLFTLMGRVSCVDESTDALLRLGRGQLLAEVEAAWHWAMAAAGAAGRGAGLPGWAFRLHDDARLRGEFAAQLRACIASAIQPYWPSIQERLETEAAVGARILAAGGIGRLLDRLHPHMQWQDGTLIVHEPGHATEALVANVFPTGTVGVSDIFLDGRGLTVVPSVFCPRIIPYASVATVDGIDGSVLLFYPALREIADAHRMWARHHAGSTRAALTALLGGTRAAALEILCTPCTTTELARRLRVSPATASHHAGVLRQAGLIATRRHGGAVLHTIIPLGKALLDGHLP